MKLSEVTSGTPLKLSQISRLPAEPGYTTSSGLPSERATALRETIVGPESGTQSDWFKKQQSIETRLRAQGQTDAQIEANPEWQEASKNLSRAVSAGTTGMALGSATADVLPLGIAARAGAEKIGGALADTGVGRFISRISPGATRRAEQGITNIATPTGKLDPLGNQILQDTVGGEYATLYDKRASMLGRAAHISDENERRTAFREIYQSPDFKALRDFENTPLGKKLTATTGRYSEVTKADPSKIPDMVFDTPQSVRDFRQLLKGNQAQVEQYAKRYAAESLHNVMPERSLDPNPFHSQAARLSEAVDKWMKSPKQEWLNETPETKKAIEQFAQGLRDTAKAQQAFRYGVTGLGAGALFEEGFHPWSWLRSVLGL